MKLSAPKQATWIVAVVLGGQGAWPDRASEARRVGGFRQLSRVASEIDEEL